uniref:Uncharacterized protein n=1 Tax=Setaria italica TaxID=4555 RepID=K4AHD3_SETIT
MSSTIPIKLAILHHAALPRRKPVVAGLPPSTVASHDHRRHLYCHKPSWIYRNDASKSARRQWRRRRSSKNSTGFSPRKPSAQG